jgi:hypothetical protein
MGKVTTAVLSVIAPLVGPRGQRVSEPVIEAKHWAAPVCPGRAEERRPPTLRPRTRTQTYFGRSEDRWWGGHHTDRADSPTSLTSLTTL